MTRIQAIDPTQATGKARDLLDAVQSKLKATPNMMRAMANSPAVLDAYLQFSGALAKGVLSGKVREQIALAVGQSNECDYCLAAHSTLGKLAGLTPEQIEESRQGVAGDAATAAILTLANALVAKRGLVSDADLAAARTAGLDDARIAEAVANVALNIFTNYFNHVAQTQVDFPAAPRLAKSAVVAGAV